MTEQGSDPTGQRTRRDEGQVLRVVVDTDSLVAAAYAARSASRQMLEGCLRREVQAVISPELHREYRYIVSRAVRGRDFSDLFRRSWKGLRWSRRWRHPGRARGPGR
jgi:hypothetical protein